MLNLPFEKILKAVSEKSGIDENELLLRIGEKRRQLSDLVSREGAVHILANELGVNLAEIDQTLEIRDIKPGMKNLAVAGKVIRVYEIRNFTFKEREGKVASLQIMDGTGKMRITLWGEQAEKIRKIKEGDVVKIKESYSKENNGFTEVHLGDKAKLIVNPEGLDISDISGFERRKISDLSENNNAEIFGVLVQLFDIRFFEQCPQCRKRIVLSEGKYTCAVHGEVQPLKSYVVNGVIDDGTGTIRAVFYKDQADTLFGKEISQEVFDAEKKEILGRHFVMTGSARQNKMFERIEYVVKAVGNVDLEAEIARI